MRTDRFYSMWFLAGIVLFGFLNSFVDWHTQPRGFIQCLGVGAWISGSVLFILEVSYQSLQKSNMEAFDRTFLRQFFLSALFFAVALFWYAIATNQGWIIVSLVFGALIYSVFLRLPFLALTRI